MSNNIHIKLFLPNDEIRRFVLPAKTGLNDFQVFVVTKLVPALANTPLDLSYNDDEGDWVRVTIEEEWQEAIRLGVNKQALRVRIAKSAAAKKPAAEKKKPAEEKKHCHGDWKQRCQQPHQQHWGQWLNMAQECIPQLLEQVTQPQQQQQQVVHQHVVCDGCDERGIRGIRHKCLVCPDFDLCSQCFNAKNDIHDPTHAFTTIEHPFQSKLNNFISNLCDQAAKMQQQQDAAPASKPATPIVPVQQVAPTVQQPIVVEQQQQPTLASTMDSSFVDIAPATVVPKVSIVQPVLPTIVNNKPATPIVAQPSAPVLNQAPIVEDEKPNTQFAQEHKILSAMGFTNFKVNEHFLQLHKGSVPKVLDALLSL